MCFSPVFHVLFPRFLTKNHPFSGVKPPTLGGKSTFFKNYSITTFALRNHHKLVYFLIKKNFKQMSKNRISANLPDVKKQEVLEIIAKIKEDMPFLISLNKDVRSKDRKMGANSVQYVQQNLQGAISFPQLIPSKVDAAEFAKDVNLISRLWEIRVPLASLLESIDDTMMAAGIDAMSSADLVYGYLKTGAKNDSSVKTLVDEIAKRFKGQKTNKKKDTTTPQTPTNTTG